MKIFKLNFIKPVICAAFALINSTYAFSQTRPIVLEIKAVPYEKSEILVSWKKPENTTPEYTGFALYRDTVQISSYEQLILLTPVKILNKNETQVYDTVDDSREYFYAVIALTKGGQYDILLPSINTTISGVRKNTENYAIGFVEQNSDNNSLEKNIDPSERMREMPLPKPGFITEKKTKPLKLGAKAEKAAKDLSENYVQLKNKITKQHIFEQDMESPAGGDEYFLFKILKNYFVKKDYYNSAKELKEFLSVHRNKDVTERALFYLGESYYFSKDYNNALLNFLQVQEVYPSLSKKWIDSSLDLIELAD